MSPVLIVFASILGIVVTGYLFGFNPLGGILGSKLSAAQIAQYAAGAGFSGLDLTTAVAIALAESGGDPNAHGDTTLGSGTGSFGLWQIYLDAHPEYANVNLYDPSENAAAAYAIYVQAGNSFTPWSTFNNGAYQAYLSQASGALNA